MRGIGIYFMFFIFFSCAKENKKASPGSIDTYYDQAYNLLDQGVADSAFLAFSEAKDFFLMQGDSLNAANCLINMAVILNDAGDYFGAQETALEANSFLDTKNTDHHIYISSNYNVLGAASSKLMDYHRAIAGFKVAAEYNTDPEAQSSYQNNLALIHQQLKQHEEALKILNEIIKSTSPEDSVEYSRILSNLARTKWLVDPSYNPVPDFMKALSIRKQANDLHGMNASYVHLSDYYSKKQPELALSYAKKMYAVAKAIKSADAQIHAISKLITLSPPAAAQVHFETYKQLTDSVKRAHAAAKNQFALIRYGAEKSKADNLFLQKENAETETRLTRQRFWTVGITASALLLLTGGLLLHKRRKQRIEMAAENKIKAVQLKTSRKVHDVVANGIYRVMTQIEYQSDFDREKILDSLEDMYNKSRDISYESDEQVVVQKAYNERISELLRSFANDDCKILIAGNDAELWPSLSPEIRTEVHHVLQELMINMRKHSEASNVLIRFENTETNLQIYYSDNGQGIKIGKTYGNGLKNTVSRIKSLAGDINFASEEGKGLKVEVKIPLS